MKCSGEWRAGVKVLIAVNEAREVSRGSAVKGARRWVRHTRFRVWIGNSGRQSVQWRLLMQLVAVMMESRRRPNVTVTVMRPP
eukprot:scaffold433045_cov45-Prasinocladus_malaysianus.AAC.1